MTGKLILVGTILTDPDGESKLERAINQLSPAILTLQEQEGYAEFGSDFINEVAAFLREDQKLKELGFDQEKIDIVLRDLRQYGFERRVAYQTQMMTPIKKVHLIGDDAQSEVIEYDQTTTRIIQGQVPEIVREYNAMIASIYINFVRNSELPRNSATTLIAQYVAMSFFVEEEREAIMKHLYEEAIAVPYPKLNCIN
ncbi:hypothetical protein HYY71_02295 [Candidatus Woesearchaeota archaeon]|nr:hypothetical protein [Candidatus Woesearchaeota archaeon]